MGANFPGSLRNKGATITEVLHHTLSELEDTIHVLDPFSLLYMCANWGRIKSRSLVKVSWLLKYQIKSVKYLLSSSYTIPGGEVWGCPWPLNRADWNKERLKSWNLDLTRLPVPRRWQPGGWEETPWAGRGGREDISFPFSSWKQDATWMDQCSSISSNNNTANFWMSNKCQGLKDILSFSHCNDSAKLGGLLLLHTQPGLGKMALLDWWPNSMARTTVNPSGTDISPNAWCLKIWHLKLECLQGFRRGIEAMIL